MKLLAALLVGLASLWASPALATDRAHAIALFEEARAAEARLELAEAARLYAASGAMDPSSPVAGRAADRLRWLELRSEGGYRPLARWMQAERDPALRRDPTALAELEAYAAELGPGRVRTELRLLCARVRLDAMGDPARAGALLADVAADADADVVQRRLALTQLAELERDRGGDLAWARAVLRFGELSPLPVRQEASRVQRRPWLRAVAWALLVLQGLVGLLAAARLRRRGELAHSFRPAHAAFSAWLGGAGALLAWAHGAPSVAPFVWLGALSLSIAVAARLWAAAPGRLGRVAAVRVALGLAAVGAAGFSALDWSDPRYLETLWL